MGYVKPHTETEPIDWTGTPEYAQGQAAFHAGRKEDDCRYPIGSGDKRHAWFTGYFDARMVTRHGACFARMGITWP